LRGVQIGPAHAAGLGLDEDLAATDGGDVELADGKRLAEVLDDGSAHAAARGCGLTVDVQRM
jgi:hypothetical protein